MFLNHWHACSGCFLLQHMEKHKNLQLFHGFLNRHQRGVVRGDATSVIESLGAAERPTRTEAH